MTAPVRLLHITTVPLSVRFLSSQIRFLRSRGFEIHVVSSPGPLLEAFGRQEGVAVHAVTMSRRITPVMDLSSMVRLWLLVRRIDPHIVHAHTPKGGLLGMLVAALASVPVRIYHLHGLPFITASGARRALLMAAERTAESLASETLCVSRSNADLISRRAPGRRVKVLLNGSIDGVDARGVFDPDRLDHDPREARRRLGIPPAARVLGFVGRIVPDKGIAQLTDAWVRLRAEHPDLHLLLVGDLEDHDPLPMSQRRLISEDSRVHLTGWVEQMPAMYRAMDLLALPSHREGFGLAAAEAAAMGLPVVATRIAGCVDAVVEGKTGLLVPPKDAGALYDGLSRYLTDPQLRRAHGAAGRARVLRDFDPGAMSQAVHDAYVRLLDVATGAADHVTLY